MTDGEHVTTSECRQQQNGDQPTVVDGTDEQLLQNGAPPAIDVDVGQLISLEDADGYHVEVRQQTEQTSHTAERVYHQSDNTEEVRSIVQSIHAFVGSVHIIHYHVYSLAELFI